MPGATTLSNRTTQEKRKVMAAAKHPIESSLGRTLLKTNFSDERYFVHHVGIFNIQNCNNWPFGKKTLLDDTAKAQRLISKLIKRPFLTRYGNSLVMIGGFLSKINSVDMN